MIYFFTSANLYANMSKAFYDEYLEAEEQGKEEKAIAATIFQALAIEAYTNLWGALVFGKKQYKKNYEFKTITEKLDDISAACSSKYPSIHSEKIRALFKKRNRLVHSKVDEYSIVPNSSFDYDNPENNYSDLLKIWEDMSFVFTDISGQMNLYSELQENIRIIRGAEDELINELLKKQISDTISETDRIIREIIKTL